MLRQAGKDWVILTPPDPSHPADFPDECIDYILMLKGSGFVEVLASEVVETPSAWSDHRPVKVELRLR